MSANDRTPTDQILDLLLDALQARQQERLEAQVEPPPAAEPVEAPPAAPDPAITEAADWETAESPTAVDPLPEKVPQAVAETLPDAAPASTLPPYRASVDLSAMLSRLFVAVVVLVIVINIPFNRFGTNLARALPDSAALVIRDGLLLKGSGDEVYVLQDNQLRWITTLDAFDHYGYRWEAVHAVEEAFLEKFETGLPIHLLLKCDASPHVYALENGQKRWIKDIPTFEAQGYLWEDIKFVSCSYLRTLPDGPPIPENAGTPPQP